VDAARLRPGQTAIACAYCGTPVPIASALAPRPLIRLSSGGKWVQGGWAGDPRVWGIFVLLALGLAALLVFGDFGPR
jgi:hypothetical protein